MPDTSVTANSIESKRSWLRAWPIVVGMLTLSTVVGVVLYQLVFYTNPLIGVWQATDAYGGQHFYEFRKDGKMLYWDLDRTDEPNVTVKRGPFHGTHHYERDTVVAQGMGDFSPRVGTLRWVNGQSLHQESDGHIMRQNLTYTRVVSTEMPHQ